MPPGSATKKYFKITINDGRIVTLEVETIDSASGPALIERVSFSFNKIEVEYVPQGNDGIGQGGTVFQDQWGESS